MKVLSLFSGVGGFDMGFEQAGYTTAFQCEIDKHARTVLDHHWPDVPKWDDVTTLTGAQILEATGGVDIVIWGSPCQDLSLAGKRAGLSGERSGLFHHGIRIIKELRELSNGQYPTWSVWENVVGALSSNGGADFGEVLYEMDEAGACFSEWSVLDAQHFGVPQRRRRVFVTSCFNPSVSERCGSPLLPVGESLPRDSKKGRKKGQAATDSATESVGAGSESGFRLVSFGEYADDGVASALKQRDYKDATDLVVTSNTFVKSRRAQSVHDHETWIESDVNPTLNVFDVGDTRATTAIVDATPIQDGREMEKKQNGMGVGNPGDPAYTLDQTGAQAVAYSIREDAKANNFSATEVETARALQSLQPSVQSHHAQTFITQPLLLDGTRVDDVRVYNEPVQTMTQRMGTGENNVPMVAQESRTLADVVGSINATDYKGGGRHQDVAENKLIIEPVAYPTLVVRRLTPLECERLMGWPDNHTAIGINGTISDTNRYKMCGNGVATPVAKWIAQHIDKV